MADLKPCPFCGEEVNVFNYCGWWVSHWCETLDRYIDTRPFFTKAIAIEAWNTRYHFGLTDEDYSVLLDEMGIEKPERTCKQEERGWGTEGDHARVWLTCGHDCMVPTVQDLPNYCPNCGAKVIEE